MNTSLIKLRPQLARQTVRLLASTTKLPTDKKASADKKTTTTTLAKPEIFSVRRVDNEKFLNNKTEDGSWLLDDVRIETEASDQVTLWSGIPKEHLYGNRRVRIFKQAKNAMQSATYDTKLWKLEFESRSRWENPLMGWGSSGDPLSNSVLLFSSKEDAIEFAQKYGWTFNVDEPQESKKPRIKSYAANFAWKGRTRTGSK